MSKPVLYDITHNYILAKVICEHSDGYSQHFIFAISYYNYDAGDYFTDAELYKVIYNKVTHYGYWDSVIVRLTTGDPDIDDIYNQPWIEINSDGEVVR